jgi:hypothetical protein
MVGQIMKPTIKHNTSEPTMKKSIVILAVAMMSLALVQGVMAQDQATQNLNLAVNAVYKIAVTGDPGNLTITTGTAGVDALTSVSDASTKYSITQNFANTVKVTANLDAVMPAGYTLQLNMASSAGSSAGAVDISATTPASAANVVTNIAKGADANQTITYTFGALASAGVLAPLAKVVTLTLTN